MPEGSGCPEIGNDFRAQLGKRYSASKDSEEGVPRRHGVEIWGRRGTCRPEKLLESQPYGSFRTRVCQLGGLGYCRWPFSHLALFPAQPCSGRATPDPAAEFNTSAEALARGMEYQRERKKETKTDRDTDTDTETQTEIELHGDKETQRQKQRDRKCSRNRKTEIEINKDGSRDRERQKAA